MLFQFWAKDTRKIKDVLDDTIHRLTDISNLLETTYKYHNNFQPKKEVQENRIILESNG